MLYHPKVRNSGVCVPAIDSQELVHHRGIYASQRHVGHAIVFEDAPHEIGKVCNVSSHTAVRGKEVGKRLKAIVFRPTVYSQKSFRMTRATTVFWESTFIA